MSVQGPHPGDPADGTAASCRRAGDRAAARGDIPGERAQAGCLALGQQAGTRGGLPPSQPGVSRPAPAAPFREREGRGTGLVAIPTLLSPGQKCRSFTRVGLSTPWGLFSTGVFQMKSPCKKSLVHIPTCAPGPASCRDGEGDKEMGWGGGRGRREKERAVGIGGRVGKCLGKRSGRQRRS